MLTDITCQLCHNFVTENVYMHIYCHKVYCINCIEAFLYEQGEKDNILLIVIGIVVIESYHVVIKKAILILDLLTFHKNGFNPLLNKM